MNGLNMFWLQLEAERTDWRCIRLYLHSRSECQWATQHASIDGQWEWFFWV